MNCFIPATGWLQALRPFIGGLLLLSALVCQPSLAAERCADFSARVEAEWDPPANCYCGASVSKVTATLPGSLKVAAACKMYRDHGVSGRSYLSPSEHLLNLDRADSHGNFAYGWIFLRGKVTLDGVVRYSNGMDEIVSFSALQLVKNDQAVSWLADVYLYRGIFFTPAQVGQLQTPDMSQSDFCAERSATLRFTDFDIKILDTDEAGATPLAIEVLRLGPWQPCAQ